MYVLRAYSVGMRAELKLENRDLSKTFIFPITLMDYLYTLWPPADIILVENKRVFTSYNHRSRYNKTLNTFSIEKRLDRYCGRLYKYIYMYIYERVESKTYHCPYLFMSARDACVYPANAKHFANVKEHNTRENVPFENNKRRARPNV